jgi:hypothetical protein
VENGVFGWVVHRVIRRPSDYGHMMQVVAGDIFPVGLIRFFSITMSSLHQARLLGGLHRASPVPFRGSYFTVE